MLYIYLPVLYYHSNLYVTKGADAGGRGFPLSQRSFLFLLRLEKMQEAFHSKALPYCDVKTVTVFATMPYSFSYRNCTVPHVPDASLVWSAAGLSPVWRRLPSAVHSQRPRHQGKFSSLAQGI